MTFLILMTALFWGIFWVASVIQGGKKEDDK
jgi:hypothetical protein